ncbi:MAG: hypothetical protein M3276_00880, partial [Actinomycetota bacterium]|nr:hypothetical protein [Actinomycetota bacterium]
LQIPVQAGNAAIQGGNIDQLLGTVLQGLQPEATYFGAENGERAAYIFFDMTDPSRIPVVAEPLFQGLNANVTLAPVMNLEELQTGLRVHAQGS